jgi:hypothetical protein
MAFNNETEKLKAQIKVLEKKLSFLEELEQTKSPVEEAYKEFYGAYPITDIADTSWDSDGWVYFEAGYNAAYKEKVAEEPIPEEEPKTLYQMLADGGWHPSCDVLCEIVKEWIFQYDCDDATCEDYLEGYIECQTVLEERLR